MSHPNKSQSSAHLRLHSSQGSITGLSIEPQPMRTSAFFLSNSSVRRLSSPGRARPVATSIADIFVRSLVLAGYCHEHLPRSRGLSTTSVKALKGATRDDLNNGGMERSSSRMPSRRLRIPMGSRSESLGNYRSRTQRIFSSSVAQRLETYDADNYRAEQPEQRSVRRPSPTSKFDEVRLGDADCDKEELLSDYYEISELAAPGGDLDPHGNRNRIRARSLGRKTDPQQNFHWAEKRIESQKSAAKKLYQDTSELYEGLFDTLDWKEAVDAVAAFLPFPPQYDLTQSTAELSSVQKLEEYLGLKGTKSHYLFNLYRDLPSPGVMHLSKRSRGALLRKFADPTHRRPVDARRYLALVEDMRAAGLPLSRSLWTSAIHLAGRSTGRVPKVALIRAIGLWNQMERNEGIESDSVVFTILFDIAVKAGHYTVANHIIKEMERRNIQFGRDGKVSKIFYHGLLEDADGVRQAFDEFVESGEIVDTAVMNCLIASFLRAGETGAARRLYHHLLDAREAAGKTPYARHMSTFFTGLNLTSEMHIYRKTNRKLGRVLQASANLKDSLPEHHRALQDAVLKGPDARTFHIVLSHHAYVTGNLKAFRSVLDDMEGVFRVPPRGMIYLLLFDGFAHQGELKADWTAEKLKMVWKAYLRALYESRSRLSRGSYSMPSHFVWENPLKRTGITASPGSTNSPGKLYTPLLSAASVHKRQAEDHQSTSVDDVHDSENEDAFEDEDDSDIDSLERKDHRVENGVFLGRRMIITILRAFGACCGPEDLMDVWIRIESIWDPGSRSGLDVLACKKELEYQLERVGHRLESQ
ncbi:hypothetical protein BJY04DRAFT_195594 [Aspergillus karnatakaensis]|uniref:pentatricopeptide repeat protein n=1 Tax=Aspergillus karnatakaensis TaxID=1810916 RepID=UPI003CCD6F9C